MTEQAQQITGEQATAQIAQRMNDPEFRTAYLSGNGPQVREMRALMEAKIADPATAGDRLDKIVAGTAEIPFMETTTGGQISTREAMESAAALQRAGLTAEQARQALSGKPVPKAEYDAIMVLRGDLMGNKDWVAKLTAGDAKARREMLLFSTVKANGYVGQEWRP